MRYQDFIFKEFVNRKMNISGTGEEVNAEDVNCYSIFSFNSAFNLNTKNKSIFRMSNKDLQINIYSSRHCVTYYLLNFSNPNIKTINEIF